VKPALVFGALLLSVALLDGCASWGRPIGVPLRNKTRFASEWKGYQERSGFKALAVAGDLGGTYVSGWTSEYREQKEATADALKGCEERRRDRRIRDECRIYAIGNEILQGAAR
jgi:hypothetical protein